LTALLTMLVLWTGVPVSCSAQPLPMPRAIAVYDMTHPGITISQSVCDRLELLRQGKRPTDLYAQRDLSEAVWVVAHEYARAHGINQQPASDCAGLTYFGDLARRLGLGPPYILALYGYAEAAKFGECRAAGQEAYTALAVSVPSG
jgi:DNA-binding transcriptional LysR family regulator